MYKLLNKFVFFLNYFISYFSRRHSYSQLLKPIQSCQPAQDEPLTNSPSMFGLHQ